LPWQIEPGGVRRVAQTLLLAGAICGLAGCESLGKLFPPSNRDPIIDAVFAARTQLAPNDTTIVHARAHDPDNDALSYEWSVLRGSLSTTTGSRVVWTAPALAGSFAIKVKVRDGRGGDADAEATVAVLSSGPPTVQIIKPAAGEYIPGIGVITIEAIASHPNGIREVQFSVKFHNDTSFRFLGAANLPPFQVTWQVEGLSGPVWIFATAFRAGAGGTPGVDSIRVNVEGVTRF